MSYMNHLKTISSPLLNIQTNSNHIKDNKEMTLYPLLSKQLLINNKTGINNKMLKDFQKTQG